MISACFYSATTGEIKQWATVDEMTLQHIEAPGLSWIELPCDTTATHIVDGLPVVIQQEKTTAELKMELEKAVQDLLDATARANGNWDNMMSARAAAAYENPFQAQALTLAGWWGTVWMCCYQILADVEAGTRPPPTRDELLAELPEYSAGGN